MPSTDSNSPYGNAITEEIIRAAANLFSNNYGIWGPRAAENMGGSIKQGARIKISPRVLKEKILPQSPEAENIYVRLLSAEGKLVGNLFATRWRHEDRNCLWITQLCVDSEYRNQGVAKRLMGALREECWDSADGGFVGILSSHAFAISAVVRVFGDGEGVGGLDLGVMRRYARDVMGSCPVGYVKEARICGGLFGEGKGDGSFSCADTMFWVDHGEPLRALDIIKEKGVIWPLGVLPEGHEFMVLVKGGDKL